SVYVLWCVSFVVLVFFFSFYFFFFFQAEDGIRDSSVTGVQTCALPIFELALAHDRIELVGLHSHIGSQVFDLRGHLAAMEIVLRSEERRVGKECRSGWWGW